ncbi:hypothetical protein PybrP1_002818, partial [[Pythium] brassicae (nom. inval.)]
KFIAYLKKENILVEGKPPPVPVVSTVRTVLKEECPTIRIRSQRDNVCDECVIYANKLGTAPSAAETSRSQTTPLYASNCKDAEATSIVVTAIDYAQNVGLPHSEKTPSKFYFLGEADREFGGVSPRHAQEQPRWAVLGGGDDDEYGGAAQRQASSANDANTPGESVPAPAGLEGAGVFTRVPGEGKRKWAIYADNCGGQNKNNTVVKYMLFLAQSNSAVNASSATNARVNLEDNDDVFRDFKTPLNNIYKNINALQSYQLLTMSSSDPGAVVYEETPESPNPEKVVDIYNKVLPFVPAEFQNDPLYIADSSFRLTSFSVFLTGRLLSDMRRVQYSLSVGFHKMDVRGSLLTPLHAGLHSDHKVTVERLSPTDSAFQRQPTTFVLHVDSAAPNCTLAVLADTKT